MAEEKKIDQQINTEGGNVLSEPVAAGRDVIGGDQIINNTVQEEKLPFFIGVPQPPRYDLIGRSNLLSTLITRLTSGRTAALALSGKGGIGKTALAVVAARHKALLDHFSDGVLFASLGPDGDAQIALGRWADALGLDPAAYSSPKELKDALQNAIDRRKLLLVINDVWTKAAAELPRCGGPNCVHLMTTHNNEIAHRFAGARENIINLPDLVDNEAFTLLKKIAPDAVAVDEAAARELAHQTGGLPLALEILGGTLNEGGSHDPVLFPERSQEQLESLSAPEFRLNQAIQRLGDLSGDKVSLADIIDLSLEGFSDEEKAAFYTFGAFAPQPAVFSREAALAVSGADIRLLSRLVNRSLLEINSGALAIHQLTADLARRNLEESGLLQDAQPRHAAYYLDLVNQDRGDWRRIDAVYEQIRWAWKDINEDNSLEWVYDLRDHQVRRGYLSETADWQ